MEGQQPSPYFGDYPHGAYWSAVAPEGEPSSLEGEDAYTVEGSRLRIMWDEGAGPIWADDGLLPDDPVWLRRALGLSEPLVTDLLAWLRDMDRRFMHGRRVADRRERGKDLERRGRELAQRLQAEVGDRFQVRYVG